MIRKSTGHGGRGELTGRRPSSKNEKLYMVLVAAVTAYGMVLLPKGCLQQGKCMLPVSGGKTVAWLVLYPNTHSGFFLKFCA
jgi:hypothetical protein